MTARRKPSLTQRLILSLMPGRAEEIERQSREWFVTCRHCGHERTYWDIGGVRYKAGSRGKSRRPSAGTPRAAPTKPRTRGRRG